MVWVHTARGIEEWTREHTERSMAMRVKTITPAQGSEQMRRERTLRYEHKRKFCERPEFKYGNNELRAARAILFCAWLEIISRVMW